MSMKLVPSPSGLAATGGNAGSRKAEVGMRFEAFSFGLIRIDGIIYEHDVV